MKMAYYENGKPVPLAVMRSIYEDVWLKLQATSRSCLLDVGGGVGLFSQTFQSRVKIVVTADISPAMIQDAHRLNPQGWFSLCEVTSLPFSKESFDRILCYSVFHYLSSLSHARKALDEFMRVLKKNGLILIGDVLYPQELLKQKFKENLSKPQGKTPTAPWWPSLLTHHLKKKTFNPEFFKKYCQRNGYRCKILAQDIEGKLTSSSRYDVILRF